MVVKTFFGDSYVMAYGRTLEASFFLGVPPDPCVTRPDPYAALPDMDKSLPNL